MCTTPARIESEYATFCHTWCRAPGSSGGGAFRGKCQASARGLTRTCDTYLAQVDFASEAAALLAAGNTPRLSHTQYLAMAMRHRFCVVAAGDFAATHKITEAMALGAAGGCLPLFVVPQVRSPSPPSLSPQQHHSSAISCTCGVGGWR